MTIKQIQIKPPDNDYGDTLHPETDSEVVLMKNGNTLASETEQIQMILSMGGMI